MDSFGDFSNNSKSKKNQKPTNFIEALKDFGSSAKQQAKDLTFGTGKDTLDQISGFSSTPSKPQTGELTPEQPFDFEEYLSSREKQIVSQEKQRFERRIEEERLVFHRKQEEAKLQVKAVQEELKKLADATEGLSEEIKTATFVATVDPGTYHEGFFDRIRRIIKSAREKIVDSKTWLQTFNHRAKKQSFYWFSAGKSGTKFTLSQERYMSTQVG
ncbi:MAG TPA: DUF5660 family protein [Candidatus Bathyarchaeia archaeon]|nr:DUF5660 family protein [Candidatus Bathyarchaeia archaeon]